jgi:hypothetical protein
MADKKYPKQRCTVEGCEKQRVKGGMCFRHFNAHNPDEKATVKAAKVAAFKPAKAGRKDKKAVETDVYEPEIVTADQAFGVESTTWGLMNALEYTGDKNKVLVDFTNYRDIYNNLVEIAKEGFRELPGQIMYILALHVESQKLAVKPEIGERNV